MGAERERRLKSLIWDELERTEWKKETLTSLISVRAMNINPEAVFQGRSLVFIH